MNLIQNVDQFDENCVFFCDPIKNNIIGNGKFIRILYSNNIITFNGIYLLIKFNDSCLEKFYNKYKCSFDANNQNGLLEKIKRIEENLLDKIEIPGKMKQFKIYELMKSGNIKIFCDEPFLKYNQTFVLKISGLWETDFQFGLTFKFLKINRLL
jgi:hypothetical protein